jgi:hypothetical protein
MAALQAVVTPGRTAHDTYCADDDWHLLDDAARAVWVDVEDAVIATYGGSR